MTWGFLLFPVHPETLAVEGKWSYLNHPQLEETVLLLGAGGRLGHRAVMPPQPPCSMTSCLQGDWRYQPTQGSVGTQIRRCAQGRGGETGHKQLHQPACHRLPKGLECILSGGGERKITAAIINLRWPCSSR